MCERVKTCRCPSFSHFVEARLTARTKRRCERDVPVGRPARSPVAGRSSANEPPAARPQRSAPRRQLCLSHLPRFLPTDVLNASAETRWFSQMFERSLSSCARSKLGCGPERAERGGGRRKVRRQCAPIAHLV